MKLILPISKKEALPPKVIETFIIKVNGLITTYNHLDTPEKKIKILKKIQAEIKKIDYRYPATYIEDSPSYRNRHAVLFQEIKKQYQHLGVPLLAPKCVSPLSQCIAYMSPKKINKLAEILVNKQDLNQVYGKEENTKEAQDFRKFLATHEIIFLDGVYSKNFRVTSRRTNKTYILKIEDRLDFPKTVEARLRVRVKEAFAPIFVERQATYKDNNLHTRTRTLLVTQYCSEQSLWVQSAQKRQKLRVFPQHVTSIFTRMAQIMLDIEQAGCLFLDAKLTNWLIHQGRLLISDTKSFLFTQDGYYIPYEIKKNKYHDEIGLACSPDFNPPEFSTLKINANAMHAFILGKNMHAYITGIFPKKNINGSDMDFSAPFFCHSPLGAQYRLLIEKLVHPDPSTRISVQEALHYLKLLTHLSELYLFKLDTEDKQMDDFINDQIELFERSDVNQRVQLLEKLELILHYFKTDEPRANTKTYIPNFKHSSDLRAPYPIENALEKRYNFFNHEEAGGRGKISLLKSGTTFFANSDKKTAQVPFHNKLNVLN
jgi:hypothetical protein